jgi:FKBP-type peptidyl-prolyl cis-trans isomerase SlyD
MIKKDMVVSLCYRLTNGSGEVLDEADSADPFSYLHGHQQVIPGMEEGLEGLKQGDKKKLTILPEDGYGEINEKLKITLNKDVFPKDFPMEAGMQFQADLGNGQKSVFTIKEIKEKEVMVDGNHPLAGETLNFDIEVLEVRQATKEELEHGHSHDGDGHHH